MWMGQRLLSFILLAKTYCILKIEMFCFWLHMAQGKKLSFWYYWYYLQLAMSSHYWESLGRIIISWFSLNYGSVAAPRKCQRRGGILLVQNKTREADLWLESVSRALRNCWALCSGSHMVTALPSLHSHFFSSVDGGRSWQTCPWLHDS